MKRTLGVLMAVGIVLAMSSCDEPTSLLGGSSPSEALLGIQASITGDPVSINRVLPCSGGGSIKLHGAAPNKAYAAGTGRYAVNVVITPERCRWTTPEGPIQLDGSPNLVLRGSREVVRGVPAGQINGSLKGKATWSVGGQTVVCKVDAAYRIDLDRPLSPTIIGQECEQYLIRRFFLLDDQAT